MRHEGLKEGAVQVGVAALVVCAEFVWLLAVMCHGRGCFAVEDGAVVY